MKKTILLLSVGLVISHSAHAAFEWLPPSDSSQPTQAKPAPQQPASNSPLLIIDPNPVKYDALPPQRVPSKISGGVDTNARSGSTMTPMPLSGTRAQGSPAPVEKMGHTNMARTSNMPDAVGFGKDLPLPIALRQIVPPQYRFDFAPTVNPGVKISWQGGKPWDIVLQESLTSVGLHASVSGSLVRIGSGASPMRTHTAMAPAQPANHMRQHSQRPSAPPASDTMPVRHIGENNARPPMGMTPMPGASGGTVAAKPMPVAAATSMPMEVRLNRTMSWNAARGATLWTVLESWSNQAGVELHWASNYDYPIQASVRYEGTFQEAVTTLLGGLEEAQPRPLGRLHPNLPKGPPVLVVETRDIVR